MRKVCRLAREVLDLAAAAAKPGVTTDFIDELVHKACIEREVSDDTTYTENRTNKTDSLFETHLVLPFTPQLQPLP